MRKAAILICIFFNTSWKNWHISDMLGFCDTIPLSYFPNSAEVGICCECELSHKVSFYKRSVKIGVSETESKVIQAHCDSSAAEREKTLREPPSEHLQLHLHRTRVQSRLSVNKALHSHLRGSGPPALVSHAEAAEALSLGHLVLPRALVLPTGHRGRSFLLQLRQMLHAAVHLQGDTVRSILV